MKISWVPSVSLEFTALELLDYQGIWCVPGSPYKSMAGALRAIAFAREVQIPFLGTCGGFQHVLIEYARNVLHLPESDHVESNPQASIPLITPLTCSLVGIKGTIFLKQGSRIQKIYNQPGYSDASIFHSNFISARAFSFYGNNASVNPSFFTGSRICWLMTF